jgi:hypothetical protein
MRSWKHNFKNTPKSLRPETYRIHGPVDEDSYLQPTELLDTNTVIDAEFETLEDKGEET